MVEKIFYEEIILECSSKTLSIGDYYPTIFFDVKILEDNIDTSLKDEINPKPKLIINNKKEFIKALESYVKKGIDFYYNGDFSHDNVKSLIAYVLSNATNNDLVNPVSFLRLRESFLNENYELYNNLERNFLGYSGTMKLKKLSPMLEAPYSFALELNDEEHSYVLPNIIFGISDDTAYIYAIQNKFLENNPLRKKINRLLFKINDGFSSDDISSVFNAKDVSMSFVASIVTFIDYLKKIGIEKIIVPINLPIRYNSHYESFNRRINYAIIKYSDDEFNSYKEDLEKQNKAYDDNTIMKLVRTFYRVAMQGDVLKINKYPFECGSNLCMKINKYGSFNNDFLNELFNNSLKRK